MGTLRNLPLGLKNAYFDFYAYFFTHGIAQNLSLIHISMTS